MVRHISKSPFTLSHDLFAGHQLQVGTTEAVEHGKYVYNLAESIRGKEITDAHYLLEFGMIGVPESFYCSECLPFYSI